MKENILTKRGDVLVFLSDPSLQISLRYAAFCRLLTILQCYPLHITPAKCMFHVLSSDDNLFTMGRQGGVKSCL